jgi:hypothetical protein
MRNNKRSHYAIGVVPSILFFLAGGCSHDATIGKQNPAVAPAIVTQPADQRVLAGTNATFDVKASGTEPLTYQWVVNGEAAAGEVYPACTVWAAGLAKDGTTFTVKVSNEAGSVTSTMARLSVYATDQAPAITAQPADLTVSEGSPAAFTVAAVGTGPLTYVWRRNGAVIDGSGFPGYQLPSASRSDSGTLFTVEVTNLWGTITSSPARLTVN